MKFNVEESDQFLSDVEEAAVWILLSNLEQSEAFAESKVDEFQKDIFSFLCEIKGLSKELYLHSSPQSVPRAQHRVLNCSPLSCKMTSKVADFSMFSF